MSQLPPPSNRAAGFRGFLTRQRDSLRTAGTTALALAFIGAFYAGIQVRNRADQAGMALTADRMDGLFASTQKDSKDIPLIPYYDQVEQILKDRFVDPIDDEQKLASGAVRGMVNSLGDSHSRYMDKAEFSVFEAIQKRGEYEGAGVDLVLDFGGAAAKAEEDPTGLMDGTGLSKIPRLVVAAVAPGGPADKAGVKPGDVVDTIDGHWVINPSLIMKYRELAAKTKDPNSPELVAMAKLLREKSDSAILPTRGWDRLMLGKSGPMDVVFERGDTTYEVKMAKATTSDAGNRVEADGALRLRFNDAGPGALKSALSGKSELTIDLRSVSGGTVEALKACLSAVAPAGTYGGFKSGKGKAATPLTLSSGTSETHRLSLLVDGGTRGMAQVFALALSSKGLATLSGPAMPADRSRTVTESLPDGTGFSLVTGVYAVDAGNEKSTAARTAGGSRS